MGLLLCNDVTAVPVDRLLSLACGNEIYRGQAIVDILNYLCANCFNEIVCVPIGTTIDDDAWLAANNNCSPDCGDIMVVIDEDDDIYNIYMRDNEGDWIQLVVGTEFRVGQAADFVDDENPTAAELIALFVGNIADHALVLINSTKVMWFTEDKGVTWDDIAINVKIAIENAGSLPAIFDYQLDIYGGAYATVYDVDIYNNGTIGDNPLPIRVGDWVLVNVDFGYIITEFADATNPEDNVDIRLTFTGPFSHTFTYSDLKNGFHAATYTRAFIATANADLHLEIEFRGTGTAPTGPQNWEWQFFINFSNVTSIRNQ